MEQKDAATLLLIHHALTVHYLYAVKEVRNKSISHFALHQSNKILIKFIVDPTIEFIIHLQFVIQSVRISAVSAFNKRPQQTMTMEQLEYQVYYSSASTTHGGQCVKTTTLIMMWIDSVPSLDITVSVLHSQKFQFRKKMFIFTRPHTYLHFPQTKI